MSRSLDYARERADATGRPYMIVLWGDNDEGPTMLDCAFNRRTMADPLHRFVTIKPMPANDRHDPTPYRPDDARKEATL